MMEFEYLPSNSPPGVPHLLSPSDARGAGLERFSIDHIRRSLSRSPSKPSRCSVFAALGHPTSAPPSVVACDSADATPRGKFPLRRKGMMRAGSASSSPRVRTSPNSPLRRALGDSHSSANTAAPPHHVPSWRGDAHRDRDRDGRDKENIDCSADDTSARFAHPIKLDFYPSSTDRLRQRPRQRLDLTSTVRSSPLKRSDGDMDLDAATTGSPRVKRRSLHSTSPVDASLYGLDGTNSDSADSNEDKDPSPTSNGAPAVNVFSTWPSPSAQSPQKRPFSLRKSTLQQRAGPSRSRLVHERDPTQTPSAQSRARSRISLDSALPLRTFDFDSPSRRGRPEDPLLLFPPAVQRPYRSAPKPHPLSNALTSTPTSTGDDDDDDNTAQAREEAMRRLEGHDAPAPRRAAPAPPGFSKSLPIGAARPAHERSGSSQNSSQGSSYATPDAYRMAKPLPQAFMSTGLISKRNRNIDMAPTAFGSSVNMPDTPSKKAHVHITDSPAAPTASATPSHHALRDFGSPSPSTPFGLRASHIGMDSFGRSVSIFNLHGGTTTSPSHHLERRSDEALDMNVSPTQDDRRLERRDSCDDLPPTPTKSTSNPSNRPQSRGNGKGNSLRSSLFGRRGSLAPDTFSRHAAADELSGAAEQTSSSSDCNFGRVSPHTPHEVFPPPDPSSLSISADKRPRTSFGFSATAGFAPATPTGPRGDHSLRASLGAGHASSSYFANDVDTALSGRFAHVTTLGIGEFSQVYKVEQPLSSTTPWTSTTPRSTASAGSHVWAVKKARRPYSGNRDRQRKLREVRVLRALHGHEHLVELVDHWESKNFLYIQTEFYENGNLKDFLLQTGFKGRLDDFRIWKIMLELARGVKSIHDANFIHLDLKPANVFIDWEGVLKIGDFGMASAWPAPAGLDGEGDREYIGPEVLSGRFDKPADVFALGMIMLEIAGNIVLPDNGTSWQRLRAGDMSDLPSLTWSSESSLVRDALGEPVVDSASHNNGSSTWGNSSTGSSNAAPSHASGVNHQASSKTPREGKKHSIDDDDDLSFLRPSAAPPVPSRNDRTHDLVSPPNFMVDPSDPESLDRVVSWMICPDPDARPRIDELLAIGGVLWVERRRRAGATVYEGAWGPADDVLGLGLGLDAKSHIDADVFAAAGLRLASEHLSASARSGHDVEMLDS